MNDNNLMIIGNGFDLAHGLPTSYADFMYFCDCVVVWSKPVEFKNKADRWIEKRKDYFQTNIEKIIDKMEEDRNKAKVDSNTALCSIEKSLDDNVWYNYFNSIFLKRKSLNKGWIDFEAEISQIIQIIYNRHISEDPFSEDVDLSETGGYTIEGGSKIIYSENLKLFLTILSKMYITLDEDALEERLSRDLDRITHALKLYLSIYIEPLEVTALKYLESAKYVISFNYTHTYKKIFPKATVFYIHGECNDKINENDNNMVIGIDEFLSDDEIKKESRYAIFKKYIRRIFYKTGAKHIEFLEQIKSREKDLYSMYQKQDKEALIAKRIASHNFEEIEKYYSDDEYSKEMKFSEVTIFGHSLDRTDGDMLKTFIYPFCTKVKIYALNKEKEAALIKNLVLILGPDRVIQKSDKGLLEFINQEELE